MAVEDHVGAREYMSLLVVALEQAAADGNWGVALLLTLIEEPPLSLFQDRLANVTPHGKPFAPLVPSPWAAICLAYIKEMELLSTKKKETVSKAKPEKPDGAEADAPSPKRKARFPKKPRDAGAGQWILARRVTSTGGMMPRIASLQQIVFNVVERFLCLLILNSNVVLSLLWMPMTSSRGIAFGQFLFLCGVGSFWTQSFVLAPFLLPICCESHSFASYWSEVDISHIPYACAFSFGLS